MAATYIPALVIKHNNAVFLTDGVVGKIQSIPTPGAGGIEDGDYWAVPITDEGVFSGFNFEPTSANDTTPPTPDSFHVFRLVMQRGNDYWYARGTTTTYTASSPDTPGYIQASADAECCLVNPRVLPTDIPAAIAPCQIMCEFNAGNKYFAIFGLPSFTSTLVRYFPYGYFNGVALPSANALGYTTKGTLLTFLNASWATVGTWSYTGTNSDILQVIQTSGSGTDVVCVEIIAISPSA